MKIHQQIKKYIFHLFYSLFSSFFMYCARFLRAQVNKYIIKGYQKGGNENQRYYIVCYRSSVQRPKFFYTVGSVFYRYCSKFRKLPKVRKAEDAHKHTGAHELRGTSQRLRCLPCFFLYWNSSTNKTNEINSSVILFKLNRK